MVFVKDRVCVAMIAAVVAALGCRGADGADAHEGGDVRRFSFARVTFDPRGISPPLRVAVPRRARSLAVMVTGDRSALYALAELETADGVRQVGLAAATELPAAMRAAYFDARSGEMPGGMSQNIRLGLFTAIFPDRPGAPLPAGDAILRVAVATGDRSRSARPVAVDVFLAEEDGGAVLPVNLFLVSRRGPAVPPGADALPFVAALRAILAGGGVDLRVERTFSLAGAELAAMTELSEPQESPASASARLALAGGAMVEGDALNLFIVDALPPGVGGWTLGTPGPPLPDTYYSGVVAARLDGGAELARVLAHEIGHYLGLRHVEHTSRSGALHRDPLGDTEPGTGNLMDEKGAGTRLTAGQAYVLSRHPLLRRRP